MTMKGVTGRDEYIIAQALAYAIITIDRLPEDRRSRSDQADMKRLLDHMIASDRELEMIVGDITTKMTGTSQS